jgi:5'-3' exoribonuclease 2
MDTNILSLYLDGVAPRAKMNQQRARRFRSAQEARENDEKKEELQKLLARQNAKKGGDAVLQEEVVQKTWDSNVITPGTPFMNILAASLRYWIAYKLNTDPAWEKVRQNAFRPNYVSYILTISDENHHLGCYCSWRR